MWHDGFHELLAPAGRSALEGPLLRAAPEPATWSTCLEFRHPRGTSLYVVEELEIFTQVSYANFFTGFSTCAQLVPPRMQCRVPSAS